MTSDNIRIGFIGAGAISRDRHLPGLAKLEHVQVVAVANRTRESGARIAGAFGIPHVEDDWRKLIARPDIDAVFIGTWPYMHREMSVAALDAGKHCFCQARMAMNLTEAREMVAAVGRHPNLVHMICPPPTRMPHEDLIRGLLASGELGELTAVQLTSINDANLKSDTLHWRENVKYSGNQIMAVGIYAETLNAWVGDYVELAARFGWAVRAKKNESGKEVEIKVPQIVSIHGKLASGVTVSEFHCGVAAGQAPSDRIAMLGTKASIHYTIMSPKLEISRPGQTPQEVLIPAGHPTTLDQAWTVERDFIEAVRAARTGKPWKVSPDFDEGLRYMRKMEAVHAAARTGQTVRLASLS